MAVPSEVISEVESINRQLGGMLEACTMPIFRDQFAYIVPHGTATLLRVGEGFYLVTARHVITEAGAAGARLSVGGFDGPKVFSPAETSLVATPHESFADVAAWRLTAADVPVFRDKTFLTLEDLWILGPPFLPGDGPFVLHGYFVDDRGAAGPDMPRGYVNPARMYMNAYAGPVPKDIFDPRLNVLFTCRIRHLFDADGRLARLPYGELRGLSGAGIVRVSPAGRHRLVAIGTAVHRNEEAFQGTRISALLQLIGNAHPDARAAIEHFCNNTDPREMG